jgi:hypothetical protein
VVASAVVANVGGRTGYLLMTASTILNQADLLNKGKGDRMDTSRILSCAAELAAVVGGLFNIPIVKSTINCKQQWRPC